MQNHLFHPEDMLKSIFTAYEVIQTTALFQDMLQQADVNSISMLSTHVNTSN